MMDYTALTTWWLIGVTGQSLRPNSRLRKRLAFGPSCHLFLTASRKG